VLQQLLEPLLRKSPAVLGCSRPGRFNAPKQKTLSLQVLQQLAPDSVLLLEPYPRERR